MKIASPETHRVLKYIAAVSARGYKPTQEEVLAYARQPRPMEQRGLVDMFTATFQLGSMFGYSSDHALNWLEDVHWITAQDGRVILSRLGYAVLDSLEAEEMTPDGIQTVVLSSKDSVAYARVVERLAEHEGTLLVDPYVRAEDLAVVLPLSTVSRILTSKKDGEMRLAGLVALLSKMAPGVSPPTLRWTNEIHGRFIIPPEPAPIFSLGTSLSGVSSRMTVLTRHDDALICQQLRELHDQYWHDGTQLFQMLDDIEPSTE